MPNAPCSFASVGDLPHDLEDPEMLAQRSLARFEPLDVGVVHSLLATIERLRGVVRRDR